MAKVNKKEIKDLGWDKLAMTAKSFDGAVQSYQSSKGGNVAVCFNTHEAFIVRDSQGLFGVEDLFQGVIKDKYVDIESSGLIQGLELIAHEEGGEVGYEDETLESLGLNDFEVRESLKHRLLLLSGLDELKELELG